MSRTIPRPRLKGTGTKPQAGSISTGKIKVWGPGSRGQNGCVSSPTECSIFNYTPIPENRGNLEELWGEHRNAGVSLGPVMPLFHSFPAILEKSLSTSGPPFFLCDLDN